ncbi:nose resistant to fluoxetine protein 6-like [Lineus longissimus]|uniref:nose resistant to fluoxetine protein 6-like n=1 Tax=Lineus longissimus TaxID=88925 RepID=UPI002B4EA7AD
MVMPAWYRFFTFFVFVVSPSSGQDPFAAVVMPLVFDGYIAAASVFHDLLNATRLNVTERCLEETTILLEGIISRQIWALNVLDSFGKPPSGINEGKKVWLGSYDQCRAAKMNDRNITDGALVEKLKHQYCLATMTFSSTPGRPKLEIGICVPSSCTREDAKVLTGVGIASLEGKNVSDNTTMILSDVKCAKNVPISTPAVIVIIILCLYGILMLSATCYDIRLTRQKEGRGCLCFKARRTSSIELKDPIKDGGISQLDGAADNQVDGQMCGGSKPVPLIARADEGKYEIDESPGHEERMTQESQDGSRSLPSRLLIAFSAYTNGKKLLSTDQPDDTLPVLHGIRFLSMTWIISGHALFWVLITGGYDNFKEFYGMMLTGKYLGLISGKFAVATFFLLSGTLLSYHFLPLMRELGGPRRVNWCYYFFHRWWRLTPTMFLVMVPYIYLFPYWVDGPISLLFGTKDQPDQCMNHISLIWKNFFYLSNYFYHDSCMGWTWYLACEWHFYCLAPVVLILFNRSWKAGLGAVIFCVIMQFTSTVAATLVRSYVYGLPHEDDITYFWSVFRFADYAIGLGLGYMLRDAKGRKIKFSRCKNIIATICMIFLWFPIIFPLDEVFKTNPVVVGVWRGLKRWWWNVGVAWIIYACSTGNGGWMTALLSWRALIPLSRLTFCAYLIHPVIMFVYQYGRRTLFHATEFSIYYLMIGHIVVTYILSFPVYLAFEAPIIGIDKAFKAGGCTWWRRRKASQRQGGDGNGQGNSEENHKD